MPTTATPRRRTGRRSGSTRLVGLVGLVVALAVLAAGCGADDLDDVDGGPDPTIDGPRVADPRFDGDFEIVGVEVDGAPVAVRQTPRMAIDAEFGALTVVTGCNTQLGSFTLAEDGRASFTVTGGTEVPCEDLADQETAILAALAEVDAWRMTDDGFRFEGGSARIDVVGPIG